MAGTQKTGRCFILLFGICLLLFPVSKPARAAIMAALESPEAGPVSGVAVIRGWAFDTQAGVQISKVELFIDGIRVGDIPCCSDRGDVQAAFPQFPAENTLNSGWGTTFNWGVLSSGTHTVQVGIRNTAEESFSTETRTVIVAKPGDFEFLDQFYLSGATARIEGDELVVEGVVVRDKATKQQKEIDTRFRWFASSQSLGMVEAVTRTATSSLHALFSSLSSSLSTRFLGWVATAKAQAAPGVIAFFESPEEDQAASGIAIIRGWAFAEQAGVSTAEVRPGATARIEEDEIVLEGVIVRDKASQQTKVVDVHLRWFMSSQALRIVGGFFHTEGRNIVADLIGEKVAFRGVNLNGLEFGTFFDNPYPGAKGTSYFKPRPEDFDSIKALGFNVIRVPFEWARLVSRWQSGDPLPTELDPTYLGILKEVVGEAAAHRLYVILDMHDFLKYWSGQSAQVCVDTSPAHQQLLAHTWQLLATHFRVNRTVLGYDIMNEPVRQEEGEPCSSCNWHAIAQSVVDAIRTVDKNHLIFIEGPNFSLASDWPVESGKTPFITDTVDPPRLVYSPHVFFDFNNDSRYDQPGEETGPIGQWEHYVRDRLLPVIDWSIDNNVPIFIGETNVPCTTNWADVLEYAFVNFFDPPHLSVTAWHYINPAYCPLADCPLNLPACPEEHQLTVLKQHPGGVYEGTGTFTPTPSDSLIYDDVRVNPWDAGKGFFGDLTINFCAAEPRFEGSCSLLVHFDQNNFAGVKFIHQFGLDTQHFQTLTFRLFLTSAGQQNFKIFTTAPRSDCDPGEDPVYPPTFNEQPELTDFLSVPVVGQWQQVEIPLGAIVDPEESIINGIAFQNMGTSQGVFYLDDIRLVP